MRSLNEGKDREPGRSHVVSVRFGDYLLDSVRRLAKAAGVSVSDWIREAAAREAAGLAEVDLQIPGPGGPALRVSVPAKLLRDAAEAHLESLASRPRTFHCPHLSVGNVASASCGTCGPMRAVA